MYQNSKTTMYQSMRRHYVPKLLRHLVPRPIWLTLVPQQLKCIEPISFLDAFFSNGSRLQFLLSGSRASIRSRKTLIFNPQIRQQKHTPRFGFDLNFSVALISTFRTPQFQAAKTEPLAL